MSFHKQLVLNRWMYGFFRGGSLHVLKDRLGDEARFYTALRNLLQLDFQADRAATIR